MHAPRRLWLALLPLVVLAIVIPMAARAATAQQLVTKAQSYGMSCAAIPSEVTCTINFGSVSWRAVIKPASGQETSLVTSATWFGAIPATGLDDTSRSWMSDMHSLACGSPAGVANYVDIVGDLTKADFGPPQTVGTCQFNGSFDPSELFAGGVWTVGSAYVPPPTPSPTPVVTPSPTPVPTAAPTPVPTPKLTATPPKPTAAPTPTAAPAQSAAPSVAPSASLSPSPSMSPSPSASSSPAPSLAPSVAPSASAIAGPVQSAGPEPTGGVAGPTTPEPSLPTFSESVLGISDVNADVADLGGSLLLALLLLLIIGFAAELFNNTVEQNYTEISGWFKKGPLGWIRRAGGRLGEARIGLLAFLALTALISSFVDPHFGFDLRSLGEFLGFLVGLIVVLASFKLPVIFARRRKTGELGRLRPLPWALIIAALFVLVSRIGNLQPGYLYGIVLGAIFVKDVSDKEEGRETFYGSLWTLGAAVIAWLGLNWVRSLGYAEDGFGVTLLSTAFAAILVAGLEAAAFGLMPLRFMPGHAVYKWNRVGWGLLFGLSVFAFIHLLIGPTSGYVADLAPEAFMAALGIFAAFGALSIGTWAFFRFRAKPAVEATEAA